MLYASGIVLLAGLVFRRTRLLAIVGLATFPTTAAVFGFLLMDNVRFIIVPLMFVVAIATAVLNEGWLHLRHRSTAGHRSRAAPFAPS